MQQEVDKIKLNWFDAGPVIASCSAQAQVARPWWAMR
jgi:hypothetical protein